MIEPRRIQLTRAFRVFLDAYARRHEGQKIYLRQAAAQQWIEYRAQILQGGRPCSANQRQLRACDERLRNVRRPGPTTSLVFFPCAGSRDS